MLARVAAAGLVLALLGSAGWLLRPADRGQHGATCEPGRVTVDAGSTTEVRLVLEEFDVMALSFRLHFDETILALDAAEPVQPSMLSGGNAIHLPTRRIPGGLEVPGTAVIGGRTFKPLAPVYRFTVRGVSPGTTSLAVDDVTIVDRADTARTVTATPCEVRVVGRPH
jgi:hypothetical protein